MVKRIVPFNLLSDRILIADDNTIAELTGIPKFRFRYLAVTRGTRVEPAFAADTLAASRTGRHGVLGTNNVEHTETQMPRRISSSQFRSKLRQAQSKLRQAQNKQRQAVNKLNQVVRTYNSKVRTHNARVRANRDRLRRELQKLAHAAAQPRYVTFRNSVQTVHRAYSVLQRREDANLYERPVQTVPRPLGTRSREQCQRD